ncbi:MAG: SDR family NAD(P)-dependent oxidoreductase [Bowdeniella nasicola]|nr:SDR family NAD(P)-dependent oxidoreductase [Bowdeniella nasicola]
MESIAVITGAASADGIGFACAKRLAARGMKVILLDLSEAVDERAAELGGSARAIRVDLTDEVALRQVIASIDEPVDVLINNAGIASPTRIGDITLAEFRHLMDVNLTGMFLLTQHFGALMCERGRGTIVNMSSVSAQQGGGNFAGAHYAASKAAIIGFTKAVAREMAPHGVRVNAVAPGLIATDITNAAIASDHDGRLTKAIPARRAGTPDEVAAAVDFLTGQGADYMVGQVLSVNGGSYLP